MKYYSILLSIIVLIFLPSGLSSAQLSPLIKFGDSYEEIVRRLDLNDRREMKENFSYLMQVGTSRGTRTKDIFYYDDKIVHLRENLGEEVIIKEAIVYLFKRGRLVLVEVMEPFNEQKWDALMWRTKVLTRTVDKVGAEMWVVQSPRWNQSVGLYRGDCNGEWFEGIDKCLSVTQQDFDNWK